MCGVNWAADWNGLPAVITCKVRSLLPWEHCFSRCEIHEWEQTDPYLNRRGIYTRRMESQIPRHQQRRALGIVQLLQVISLTLYRLLNHLDSLRMRCHGGYGGRALLTRQSHRHTTYSLLLLMLHWYRDRTLQLFQQQQGVNGIVSCAGSKQKQLQVCRLKTSWRQVE